MPILAPQFRARIEATVSNSNYTVHMHEWHDGPNNRARTDTYRGGRWQPEGESRTVFDIDSNIYWHMSPSGCVHGDMAHLEWGWDYMSMGVVDTPACTEDNCDGVVCDGEGDGPCYCDPCSADEEDEEDNDYGGWGESSEPRLASPNEVFHFGGELNETYEGAATVRGIAANKWSHFECGRARPGFNFQDGDCSRQNYTINYYFSMANWSLPEAEFAQVPLRVEILGTRARNTWNRTCANLCDSWQNCDCETAEADWEWSEYQLNYEYTSFHAGPMGDWAFEQPCGVVCESVNASWDPYPLPVKGCPWNCDGMSPESVVAVAEVPAPPPPVEGVPQIPAFPPQFSATIEMNDADGYTVHRWEEYDSHNNRARFDQYHSAMDWGDEVGDVMTLYDLEANTFFHTNSMLDTCLWGDMDHLDGNPSWDGIEQSSGTTTLQSADAYFGWGQELNGTYVGTESVRGILCDHWTEMRCGEESDDCSSNYTMDYYFSAESWDIPEAKGTRVPIRMAVNWTYQQTMDWECYAGCEAASDCIDAETDCELPAEQWSVGTWAQSMEYTSFHVGPPEAWLFEVPCGQTCSSTNTTWNAAEWVTDPCDWETECACEGFNSCQQTQCFPEDGSGPVDCTEPQMPILAPQFRARIEATISDSNYTVHMHEWYDGPTRTTTNGVRTARAARCSTSTTTSTGT
jgi:hypothetical protein